MTKICFVGENIFDLVFELVVWQNLVTKIFFSPFLEGFTKTTEVPSGMNKIKQSNELMGGNLHCFNFSSLQVHNCGHAN